jgi:DNA-binding response OmpR family regulator
MLIKKIVIAEDDDAIAHMVSMALGDAGYLCIRARDGEEALRMVRMHLPDLLVLDVMMPRLDGHGVAERLKADVILSKIPILMLTALGDVDSKIKGLDAGADAYVSKPFDLREFSARVRALVRASKRERDRNPTTDLPGSVSVDEHITGVLEKGADMAVIHFDVLRFAEYADVVGWARSETFLKSLSDGILAELRNKGGGFMGHLGGPDFIAVIDAGAAEGFAEAAVAAFDSKRDSWADSNDVDMKLVAGLVKSSGVKDDSELAAKLTTALRESKQREGSNYVVAT